MPEKWTGRLRGHMFNENISVRELAQAAGWSFAYVSAILHGKRIACAGGGLVLRVCVRDPAREADPAGVQGNIGGCV